MMMMMIAMIIVKILMIIAMMKIMGDYETYYGKEEDEKEQ